MPRYLPGMVMGIFIARLLGELVGVPDVGVAVVLSLGLAIISGWLLSRWSLRRTWPWVVLLAYVIYPEVDFGLAGLMATLAVLALALNERGRWGKLPFRYPWLPWLVPLLLGITSFLLYWATLAPGVLAADSGELQVVAAQLGVAHPPGFPLYTIMAHLFTRLLPFVSPAYAINLFSAVTSALAVVIVHLCVKSMTARELPGIGAAIALATATTYWSQATTANVRSLTGLFAAVILLSLIRFYLNTKRGARESADRWLVLAALFMGFGLTHHVSLLFLVAIGLLFIVVVDRSLVSEPRRWVWPVAAVLLGFLPLVYLPFRAMADVRGASPDLATWPGFLEHALATGFRGDLFYYLAPADLWQRTRILGNVMAFQFAPIVLISTAIGALLIATRHRLLAFLLVGTFIVYAFVAATYRAPQTVEYMLPAYIIAVMILGYVIGWMLELESRVGFTAGRFSVLVAALLLAGAATQLWRNHTASGAEHEANSARDYVERLITDMPHGGVILAHWHWVTPLWYLQEVEGLRPDVDIRFVFPEGESYETTWIRRTNEAFAENRDVLTTWVPPQSIDNLPTSEPFGEALLFPQIERAGLPSDFIAAEMMIGSGIELLGYQINPNSGGITPGEEAEVTIAWRPVEDVATPLSMYLHLVGEDGVIWGQDDRNVTAVPTITLTQFRVTSRLATPLGKAQIYVGAVAENTGRILLTEVEIVGRSHPYLTQNRVYRLELGEENRALVGYDWDQSIVNSPRLYLHWKGEVGNYYTQVVDNPAGNSPGLPAYRGPWGAPISEWHFPQSRQVGHYVPFGKGIIWTGETMNGLHLSPNATVVIDADLHSSQPINRDYVISVRLIGLEPDGIHWAWWDLEDSVPAMGAIPTLKWIEGSFVRSPHRVTVSGSATAGQELTGALTIYDAFTNRQVPILDERITAETPWIPLGKAAIEVNGE